LALIEKLTPQFHQDLLDGELSDSLSSDVAVSARRKYGSIIQKRITDDFKGKYALAGHVQVTTPSHTSHPTPHTHISHLTPHTSHLTPHTSHPYLTPHTSHLTPHTSHLTPHTSHLTHHAAIGTETSAIPFFRNSCCSMLRTPFQSSQERNLRK
jgi:hypothetical protein